MVEMGHKDTGFPIEALGPSHDTSTFISFNNLIGWPDKNRAKLLSLPRSAGVANPTVFDMLNAFIVYHGKLFLFIRATFRVKLGVAI